MRSVPLLLLAAALAAGAGTPTQASAQARSAHTLAPTSLRAVPSPGGRVIHKLARGHAVQVGGCALRWCAVSVRGRSGYLPEHVLSTSAPAAQASPAVTTPVLVTPTYASPPRERPRAKQSTASSGAPAGASARCRDGTYSFSSSRRGTCSHHGGVSEWL
jgi:hypothetical protein